MRGYRTWALADSDRFFVVTGGPGSGKSTLLDALERAGYARSIEAGRAVIQDQTAIDGPAVPWRDRELFAQTMLTWEPRSYRMASERAGVVFFDRGIADVAGYLRVIGSPVPEDFGYELIEVPRTSVEERVGFVLDSIAEH